MINKKIVAGLLAALTIAAVPANSITGELFFSETKVEAALAANEFVSGGIVYAYYSDGTAEAKGRYTNTTVIRIPATVTNNGKTYKVTKIGANAFANTVTIKTVDFSGASYLRTIGSKAFYRSALISSITIPNSVNTIQSSAFEGCTNLRTLTFQAKGTGSTALTLGSRAFATTIKLSQINFNRENYNVQLDIFDGANVNVESLGYGLLSYVNSMSKLLVDSWDLNYEDSYTVSQKKDVFEQLTRKINSYLTYNATMDYAFQGSTATVLSVKNGTCGGFARVFYSCALALGVKPTEVLVGGDAHCHAWNYVKIGNYWYNYDATNIYVKGVYYNTYFMKKNQYMNFMNTHLSYNNTAHNPANWVVCVDDQRGTSDAPQYNNPKIENFDKFLRERNEFTGTRA